MEKKKKRWVKDKSKKERKLKTILQSTRFKIIHPYKDGRNPDLLSSLDNYSFLPVPVVGI